MAHHCQKGKVPFHTPRFFSFPISDHMPMLYILYQFIEWWRETAQLPDLAEKEPSPPCLLPKKELMDYFLLVQQAKQDQSWWATAPIQRRKGRAKGEDRRTGSRKEKMRRNCVKDPALSWQLRCSGNHTPNATMKHISLFLILLCCLHC